MSRCLASAISNVNLLFATRSRVVDRLALRMSTCASLSAIVMSESSRARSSASTWMLTRKLDWPVGAHATSLESQPERLLEVEWAPTGQSTFLVNIQVEALDRNRLLSDITMVLSDAHVNILSASLSTTRDRVAKSRFTFEMAEAKHLDNVLRAVRGVPGVFDAYRVTQ